MSEKSRWIILILSLVTLYSVGYIVYTNTTTGHLIFGVIPEFLVYLISGYFISSVLIEILVGEPSNRNLKQSLTKALKLLFFFILFVMAYWLIYKYIILANGLKDTFIGKNSYLILLILIIFCGMRFAK
ncbi:hypothetical protein RFH42_01305 [Acinetobacter rudis]|uniref:hypothetical protein n=1 Tax=Acinetobacter rudis TaxID=632955 RepID=UPI00280F2CA8|nr:hypothetical protein [Acinetobacter rudis]MDQ8951600.1 hypothetical protein [Acinetobacter rudis]